MSTSFFLKILANVFYFLIIYPGALKVCYPFCGNKWVCGLDSSKHYVSTSSTSANGKSKCAGPPGTTVCNSCMLQQRLLLPKVLQKQDCSLLLSTKQFIYNRSIRCMNPSTTWPCWLPRPDAITIGALDTHLLPIDLPANSKRAHTWINLTMVLNPRAREGVRFPLVLLNLCHPLEWDMCVV